MEFDFSFIRETLPDVLKAVPLTLLLSLLPVVAGAVIGFLLALVRVKKVPVVHQLLSVFLSFFRGVPLLLLLFLAYYGIPKAINYLFYDGIRTVSASNMSSLVTAFLVLTLYSSAFLCEIIRGALISVDMKQLEAAHSLGMTKLMTYFRIVIPQAIIVALPNYFNFVLAMIKNTSIVFTISVMDMMAAAKVAAEEGYRFIEAYFMVGILYIIFSFVFSKSFAGVEKRAKRHMGMEI